MTVAIYAASTLSPGERQDAKYVATAGHPRDRPRYFAKREDYQGINQIEHQQRSDDKKMTDQL